MCTGFYLCLNPWVKFKGIWGGIRGVKGQTGPVNFGKVRSCINARDPINQEWIRHRDAPGLHRCEGHCRSTGSAHEQQQFLDPQECPEFLIAVPGGWRHQWGIYQPLREGSASLQWDRGTGGPWRAAVPVLGTWEVLGQTHM